jgi:hypothetical protein
MKDRLFVLRPGFTDQGQAWFCPYSAQVIGYLTYYPAVRDTLDLAELEFPRPRHPLVDLVGEANQSMPCLVLGDGAHPHVDGVTIQTHGEHRFVSKTIEILRYLAATRGTPPPH